MGCKIIVDSSTGEIRLTSCKSERAVQVIRQRVQEIRADARTGDTDRQRCLPQRRSCTAPVVDQPSTFCLQPPSLDVRQRTRNGRIHYDASADSFDDFLRSFRPSDSALLKNHQVYWIQCSRPTQTGVESVLTRGPFEAHLGCLSRGEITKDVCVQRLLEEARRQGQLTGKWMVFTPCSQADMTWGEIAKSTIAGRLGCSAKVATFDPTKDKQLICVYVRDSADQKEVGRVLSTLQRLGCPTVVYKMDLYTHLGIYRGNQWGLDPCLYRPHHFNRSY